MSTSPVEPSVWVVVPIVVQRYLPGGMFPAKYISTMPAMMPSLEKSKGPLANRRIADRGMGIWFPMVARGRAGHIRKIGDQDIML